MANMRRCWQIRRRRIGADLRLATEDEGFWWGRLGRQWWQLPAKPPVADSLKDPPSAS